MGGRERGGRAVSMSWCRDCGRYHLFGSHVPRKESVDEPCQCHGNTAYIAPTHDGHCCFLSADQICHQAEFADWRERWRGPNSLDPDNAALPAQQ